MKWQPIATAALLTVLSTSIGLAQCNRGSRQATSPSAGNLSAQYTQSSLANPFNVASFQSQQALQQRLLAQQFMYRQALAQQQRNNATQLAQQRRLPTDQLVSSSSRQTRQARLRQQNAERALELASKAEANGRLESAEKYYRRAIRIAGKNSSIGEQAEAAIASLSPDTSTGVDSTLTILASIEP